MVDFMNKDKNTEERILKAARTVFIEKGYNGARMQEIADKAEINKAMLHYYFRDKEKLFYKIFEIVFQEFFPIITDIISSEMKFEDKVRQLCNNYVSLFQKNPYIPLFILSEINRNPDKLQAFANNYISKSFERVRETFSKQLKKEKLRQVDVRHIIMNIISLSVFHFIAMPMFKTIFNVSESEYFDLIEERKVIIADTIISWLKNTQD